MHESLTSQVYLRAFCPTEGPSFPHKNVIELKFHLLRVDSCNSYATNYTTEHRDRLVTSSETHLNKNKMWGQKTVSTNSEGLRPGQGGLWRRPVILC